MTMSRNPYATFVYHLAKVWGFAPFTLTSERAYLGSSSNVVYSTILSILCIPEAIGVMIINRREENSGKTVLGISRILSLELGIFGGGLYLISIVMNRRNIANTINTLYRVNGLLDALGARKSYEQFFKTRAILVGIAFCTILSLLIGTLLYYGSSMASSFTFWMVYLVTVAVWLHVVHHQGLFIFCNAMDLVRNFYQRINDQLLNVCRPECGRRDLHWYEDKVQLLHKLEVIGKAYDEIRVVTDNLVEVFSPPIIATIAYYFTLILNTCYNIYLSTPGAMDADCESVENVAWVFVWLSLIVFELVRMAAVCSSTQKAANSTAVILHRMWLHSHPVQARHEEQGVRCAMSLYYMAKVWGLAPFAVVDGRVHFGSSIQIAYPIVLSVLCTLQVIGNLIHESWIGYGSLTGMMYMSGVLSVHLGNLSGGLFAITFVLKRRKIVATINALQKLDDLLSALRVHQDYQKYFKSRLIAIGSISCVTIVIFFGTNISHLHASSPLYDTWASLLVIVGCWMILIQSHGIFVFVFALDFVRKRYEQLNYLFTNVYTDVDKARTRGAWNIAADGTWAIRTRISHRDDPNRLESLKKVEDLYDHLRDITDDVVDIFGTPIVGSLAYYFSTMLNVFYFIYVGAPNLLNMNDQGIIWINITFWMFVTLLELFAIAALSSSLQKTANSTTVILHKMWLKHHPAELKDEIQMLSLQLLQRPLTISAFGFFSLDYSYLYKIFCAVVAYFIIMIQLDTTRIEPTYTNSTSNLAHVQ